MIGTYIGIPTKPEEISRVTNELEFPFRKKQKI
jgi:hypothetical protein